MLTLTIVLPLLLFRFFLFLQVQQLVVSKNIASGSDSSGRKLGSARGIAGSRSFSDVASHGAKITADRFLPGATVALRFLNPLLSRVSATRQRKYLKRLDATIIFIFCVDIILTLVFTVSMAFVVAGGAYVTTIGSSSSGSSLTKSSGQSASSGDSNSSSSDGSYEPGDVEPPEGIDSQEWAKAPEWNQLFAKRAYETINTPFNPKSTGADKANGHLVYTMNAWEFTNLSYWDCSSYVGGVAETFGYHISGRELKPPYSERSFNFTDFTRAELDDYLFTGRMIDEVPIAFDSASTPDYRDKLLPGDILTTAMHTGVYIGKNKDGKRIIANMLYYGQPTSRTVDLEGSGLDGGFTDYDTMIGFGTGDLTYVMRPAEIFKDKEPKG